MQSDILAAHTDLPEQFRAIRLNDEKALKLFYQAHYARVEKYVRDNSGTTEEAKDIYQEAFIAVWRNIQLDRFTPGSNTSLGTYLYTVARHKWLDHLRAAKRKPQVSLSETTELAEPPSGLSEEELQRINSIKSNFGQLGKTCRDVLERFYYKKQSMRTISAALQWTEATARNNKYRCIQRLKELVNKQSRDVE